MPTTARRFTTRTASVLASLIVAGALSGCGLNLSLHAEARDEWKKSYEVAPGAELEIRAGNGTIRVESADITTIEVVATRIVRASTDEAAKAALADFTIEEAATPAKVLLDAAKPMGVTIGLSRTAKFDVKVPRGLKVVLKASNGEISAAGLDGDFQATTTNGTIAATEVGGAAQLASTNGTIRLDLVRVADAGVTCETTNGTITVALPRDGAARISARVTNGGISTGDLPLQVTDQSRQRLEATLGKGGPVVRLETTNGMVSVKGR